jgi:CubicO group peptidase (beta-lactamase class C family)
MSDNMKTFLPLVCIALCVAAACSVASEGELQLLDGGSTSIADMERSVAATMEKAGVPGLSCAIINGSRIVYVKGFGVRDAKSGQAVDEQTVFAAASFSKTVFAYLVMLLVEDGVIDLDKPLYEYLGKPLPEYPNYADLAGDDRHEKITARIVLSHTTGFPNWRFFAPDSKLIIQWTPGERFGYSGEGIALLQMVVEEVTGRGLEDLARERVFDPLEMNSTSYVWHDRFEENLAVPHDQYERSKRFRKRGEADAAGSMATTAGDYAKLLVAILSAEAEATAAEILRPQIEIRSQSMFGPGARRDNTNDRDIDLAWGIGWGRFDCEYGRAFFHTGHEGGTQNYNVTFTDKGIGVVFLSNSDNFEGVARELLVATIGDTYSPCDWLGYPRFDPSQSREPPPERAAIDVDPAILATYAGVYRVTADLVIYVKSKDGRLLVSTDKVDWAPMLAETESRFFVEGEDAGFVFVRNDEGAVAGLTLEVQGAELRGEKIE